jgi:hypothetical protein
VEEGRVSTPDMLSAYNVNGHILSYSTITLLRVSRFFGKSLGSLLLTLCKCTNYLKRQFSAEDSNHC